MTICVFQTRIDKSSVTGINVMSFMIKINQAQFVVRFQTVFCKDICTSSWLAIYYRFEMRWKSTLYHFPYKKLKLFYLHLAK